MIFEFDLGKSDSSSEVYMQQMSNGTPRDNLSISCADDDTHIAFKWYTL